MITQVDRNDGLSVVELVGEIDMDCDGPVRAALCRQLDQRPAGLVVDLTGVDFFGSTGIRLLVEASARAQRLGVAFAVAARGRAVLRPLEITFVGLTLDVHPTRQDALDALRAGIVPAARRAGR
ncbi:STAS domain-containing protein [Saccharothrix algeriensis]|nr:STAS domain-containing protein [Saccharothrix algeriensis]MBM7814844.1 anti-anti-sigma factor [Saccharothrix algeriensis]